jgi:hypothetical protein
VADKRTNARARDIDSDLSRRALAALLGTEARRSRQVVSFRTDVLHDQLLRPSAIPAWVEEQHQRDKTPASLERARQLDTAHEIRFGRRGIQPVFPLGVLDRLRTVSDHLAATYGWERGAATDFVLAGSLPQVPSLTVRYGEHFRYPRLSRITLEVDPSVGPREVMRQYRAARALFIPGRTRRIGVKSSELVLFHLEQQAKHRGLTWRKEMEQWNRKHSRRPSFRFRQESNYAAYFRRAANNLLMAEYGLSKKRSKGK